MPDETRIKGATSVAEMCRLLGMSRSQFYLHVKRGTFHEPMRLSNGRPFFTASQVEDNLKARELGIGVDGEYVLFYQRKPKVESVDAEDKPKADISALVQGLKSLGLTVTGEQVEAAVETCYPKGTAGTEETDILRAVFRHMKRSGSG